MAAWCFRHAEGRTRPGRLMSVDWSGGEPVEKLQLLIVEEITNLAHWCAQDEALLQLLIDLVLAARFRQLADDFS